MSQSWCPTCQKFFPEPGFCPYDGSRLQGPPDGVDTRPQSVRSVSAHDDAAAALAIVRLVNAEYDRLVGQTLDGRYKIERKIGEGGMGVVFAARHAVIERPLAIKVLKRDVARDMATIKRFVQEAKAASRIGHPNIVDVTDFGSTPDGMTYSVMEYVDGQTLSAAIKQGPMTPARALPIVAQIARALGAAHAKGIVHRDLKPENVFLVNRDGRVDFVKIVDFGIAKVTPLDPAQAAAAGPRLTRAGSVFGTPEYMAPEQAAGRSDTDGRVDIYALGIILYELLLGHVPHKGDTMVRTLAMVMLEAVVPPSQARPELGIGPELEAVMMKALAKRREDRYASMDELLAALSTIAGVTLTQPVSTSVDRVGDGSAPHPVPVLPTLPPGADRALLAATSDVRTPVTRVDGEAPRATQKKVRSEPAFVGSQRPVTFEHVFETGTATSPPRPRQRWPMLLLLVVAVGVVSAAVAIITMPRKEQGAAPLLPHDARAPLDASVVVEVPIAAPDAGAAPGDAGMGRVVRPDLRRVDAGNPHLTPRGSIAIQVITKPEGAAIYLGTTYRGSSGTTIEEPPGTKGSIRCTLPGYQPGVVEVVFDGQQEVVLCRLERIKRCIDGIKNPFDDCPE